MKIKIIIGLLVSAIAMLSFTVSNVEATKKVRYNKEKVMPSDQPIGGLIAEERF